MSVSDNNKFSINDFSNVAHIHSNTELVGVTTRESRTALPGVGLFECLWGWAGWELDVAGLRFTDHFVLFTAAVRGLGKPRNFSWIQWGLYQRLTVNLVTI